MSFDPSSLIGFLQRLVGFADPVAQAVGNSPGLKNSVTLIEVLAGLKAAGGLDWAEIEKATKDHFASLPDDLTSVEDLAKAVAPFFPAAIYVSDVAAVLLVVVKISDSLPPDMQMVKTKHYGTKPIFGPDSPAADADWSKIGGF